MPQDCYCWKNAAVQDCHLLEWPAVLKLLQEIRSADYGFVKVNGKEFYYRGKPILFSGLGVGSWLNMEHFMLGLPGTDKQIRNLCQVLGKEEAARFFDSFILNFLRREDFPFPEGIRGESAARAFQLQAFY